MSHTDTDDARYNAIVNRDKDSDGLFFYAVRTTGVYCRPSCAARPPLRKNVEFFVSSILARSAGYRACRRCCPDDART
ncbi:Ada metal-binding domain-containing protein [Ponticaulis koreensis]|uniref:Ada metal-binding domain-containing protein n=1 Tax=Ponticaulis koreensis TaxID=1123045 RepID=UPI0009DBFF67